MNITVSPELLGSLGIEAPRLTDPRRHCTLLSQQYRFEEGCFEPPALASLLHLHWTKPTMLFGAKPYLMRRTLQNYRRTRSGAPEPPSPPIVREGGGCGAAATNLSPTGCPVVCAVVS